MCLRTEFSLSVLVSLIYDSFKGLFFDQLVGEVSYGEDKGVVRLAIPNASLQRTWHVSCRLFLLFVFLTGTSHDHWKQEEERRHLGFVVTGEVLISV